MTPAAVTVCGVEVPRHPRYRLDFELDAQGMCIRICTGTTTRAEFELHEVDADVEVDMRPVYDTPQEAAAALTRALVSLGLDERLRAAVENGDHSG